MDVINDCEKELGIEIEELRKFYSETSIFIEEVAAEAEETEEAEEAEAKKKLINDIAKLKDKCRRIGT